jgi:hypothetical protein
MSSEAPSNSYTVVTGYAAIWKFPFTGSPIANLGRSQSRVDRNEGSESRSPPHKELVRAAHSDTGERPTTSWATSRVRSHPLRLFFWRE